MVHGRSVVGFVDGNRRVNNLRCNSFLLNDWLNVLMNVVVGMLA